MEETKINIENIEDAWHYYINYLQGDREVPVCKARNQRDFLCPDCNVERVLHECFKVCPECGQMDIGDPVFEDIPYTAPPALYKRRLYCVEKLNLMVGYKQSRSPQYNKLVKLLKNEDIESLEEIKVCLKAWKMKKFYKHVYNLYYDVTGERLINLNSQDIDFIARKFVELESNFKMDRDTHKRNNIYNYNSCIYLLMKHFKYKGYKHILLPLNHLQIAKVLKKYIQ